MRYIGSFNDFGSLVAQDMATAPAPTTRAVPVPTAATLAVSAPERRWSLESDSSVASRCGGGAVHAAEAEHWWTVA